MRTRVRLQQGKMSATVRQRVRPYRKESGHCEDAGQALVSTRVKLGTESGPVRTESPSNEDKCQNRVRTRVRT